MIEEMHADGVRIFVEVGPGSTLTPLVGSILSGRPHQAIAIDRPGLGGLTAALQALGRLFVAGVSLRLDRLHVGRSPRPLDPQSFLPQGERAGTVTDDLAGQRRPRAAGERSGSETAGGDGE